VAALDHERAATPRDDVGDVAEEARHVRLVRVAPAGQVDVPALVRERPRARLWERHQGRAPARCRLPCAGPEQAIDDRNRPFGVEGVERPGLAQALELGDEALRPRARVRPVDAAGRERRPDSVRHAISRRSLDDTRDPRDAGGLELGSLRGSQHRDRVSPYLTETGS
jgi:hypothetical protein